jgi:SAM-dependent MidA family methyltransferase
VISKREQVSIDAAFPMGSELPVPDELALAHSEMLSGRIREEIAASGGALSFMRFMELALYAPGFGYYCAGQNRFGAGGDFVTAPGVSALFGRCLARQVAEGLDLAGPGAAVLEFGAGSGRLAADLVMELGRLGLRPAQYLILEPSADLRACQQSTLRDQGDVAVRWLDRLPSRPWRGVVIANEVLDAMPVARFRMGSGGDVEELCVTSDGAAFTWTARAASPGLEAAVRDLETALGRRLPPGYTSELRLHLPAWLCALSDLLERGLLLLIDYGYTRREYYHPQRRDGTLICHYRHRAHDDPLRLAGLQDMSAFVDFSALADAARACGLEVLGFATQAHFLLACGLGGILERLLREEPQRYAQYASQAKRLTLPGEMGERFKVLALGRRIPPPLLGFSVRDHRARL